MNDLIKEKERFHRELQKRLKRTLKHVQMLTLKQEESLNWAQTKHEGLLLQSHLYLWKKGLHSLEVSDWENEGKSRVILLSPPLSGQEEVALRFRKSRKQRLAIPHVERELSKALERQKAIESQLTSLEAIETLEELQPFQELLFPPRIVQPKAIKPLKLPYKEYFSSTGQKIWVGKKAQDNETLTFTLAHGNDWWLHVQGAPGSHVVIKSGKAPDAETLQDALQLALIHSQAKKQRQAEVIVTQQKYVSRFGKGAKNCGKVQVSQHKLYSISLDLQHFERIQKQTKAHTG
ncbi:MAG: NFACT RNA binding domain-containing protein [Parachlamydiaceae bacterium]